MSQGADRKAFGEVVRHHRRRAGKTLREVANAIKRSVSYLSDIERGVRHPFPEAMLPTLAEALNAPLSDLVAGRAASEGAWRLAAGLSPAHDELAARLVARWSTMTPENIWALVDAVGPLYNPEKS